LLRLKNKDTQDLIIAVKDMQEKLLSQQS